MASTNSIKHRKGGSMNSAVIDLNRERRINALVDNLGSTLESNPEATDRTFQFLNGELQTMKDKTGHTRAARWRKAKKEAGCKLLSVWIEPEAIAALTRAKDETGQTIETTINKALTTEPAPPDSQFKPMPGETAVSFAKRLKDGGMVPGLIASHLNVVGLPTQSGKGLWDHMKVHNLFSEKQRFGARKARDRELEAKRIEAAGQGQLTMPTDTGE